MKSGKNPLVFPSPKCWGRATEELWRDKNGKRIWEARLQVSCLHPDCACWRFEWDFWGVPDHMPTGHWLPQSEVLSHSAAGKGTAFCAGWAPMALWVGYERRSCLAPSWQESHELYFEMVVCPVHRKQIYTLIEWFILSDSKRNEGESDLSRNDPIPATPLLLENNHQILTEWWAPACWSSTPLSCAPGLSCVSKKNMWQGTGWGQLF